MRTVPLNVYKFDELSPKAKERAKQDYAIGAGYVGSEEAFASLKALAKYFDCTLVNYEVDWFNTSYSTARFSVPDEPLSKNEIARRLNKLGTYNEKTLKGHGDCKLTGYCMDEDCIDGFRQGFHQGITDLSLLMDMAFRTWLLSGQADCEDFYSDKQFSEHSYANEHEYTAAGKFYREAK